MNPKSNIFEIKQSGTLGRGAFATKLIQGGGADTSIYGSNYLF